MTEVFRDACSTFEKWTVVGAPTIAAARNGNGFSIAGTTNYLETIIPSIFESDTVTLGFAFRRTDALTGARSLMYLRSDAGATDHGRLTYTPSSTTLAWSRASTSIASSTTVTFAQNTWYYVEVQVKLAEGTDGFVIVRVNGTEVINVTGLDTKQLGTKTTWDYWRIWSNVASATNQYDDIYLKTGAGETFLGDPGSVTTSPGYARMARQQLRVLTSPYDPGVVLARHQLRVAIDPATPEPGGVATVWAWDGADFVESPVWTWDGAAFVEAVAVRTWDGAAFVPA